MLNMKKTTINEAEALLEKYYEGTTSTAEEKRLCFFLSQEKIPERFKADRALLTFFAEKKQKPKTSIIPFLKWASIAAIFLGIVFFSKQVTNEKQTNFAYINGHKYTDSKMIKEQALASLAILSTSCDEIEASANNLHDDDLVKAQLQLFSEE